ncbi:MAG: hypothetical protein ABSE56_02425 [Bryobacteraceae bacterium]
MKTSNIVVLAVPIVLVVALALFQASPDPKVGPITTTLHNLSLVTIVTAVYAGLVWLQLKQSLDDRDRERKEARVTLTPGEYAIHISTNNARAVYTMSCAVVNSGRVLAKFAQPVLTGVAIPSALVRVSGGSAGQPVPMPLHWSDDELKGIVDQPTQERYLLPARQYFYNLAIVDTSLDEPNLQFATIELPNQRPTYGPGRFMIEITVFVENGEPLKTYYELDLRDAAWKSYRCPTPTLRSPRPPSDFERDLLQIKHLPSRPRGYFFT